MISIMLKSLQGANINRVIKYVLYTNLSVPLDSTEVFDPWEWFHKHLKLKDKAQYFQWPPLFPDVHNRFFESKSLIKVMNFSLEVQAKLWENCNASTV